MHDAKKWLLAALIVAVLGGGAAVMNIAPPNRRGPARRTAGNQWRNHDGHWSFWHAGDKRWYYTDGTHWYYHNGLAWVLYPFDKLFGRDFHRGDYRVPPPAPWFPYPIMESFTNATQSIARSCPQDLAFAATRSSAGGIFTMPPAFFSLSLPFTLHPACNVSNLVCRSRHGSSPPDLTAHCPHSRRPGARTARRLDSVATGRRRADAPRQSRRSHLDRAGEKGRRTFSLGVWAGAGKSRPFARNWPRSPPTEAYAKKRAASTLRRERSHAEYVQEFRQATLEFLAFAPLYAELAARLAEAVARHATPVGSGTVARTQRIPIQRRAEAAVIAWLRHQTTAYDELKIPRVKGKRREVRRMLAEQSRQLLKKYREGELVDLLHCPLHQARKLVSERHAGTVTENDGLASCRFGWTPMLAPARSRSFSFVLPSGGRSKSRWLPTGRMRIPRSEFIDTILVPSGMNIADRRIVELVSPGDLVITADIPLAADVVAKGGQALDPRGELYTDDNVGERLAVRNMFDGLRGEGHNLGGLSNFTPKDRQAFANQLDRWLAKVK